MSRILIVDDEPRILLLLQSLLKANGYEVESARDGASALDIVRKGEIDITITDLRMSPMDGMTLFKEIKNITPDMPVILLTAYATVETAVEARPILREFQTARQMSSFAKSFWYHFSVQPPQVPPVEEIISGNPAISFYWFCIYS